MLDRTQIYSIVGQVLTRFADKGHTLSVDQHLRLFTLLDRINAAGIAREQLPLVLTPILANSVDDQLMLHTWFKEAILWDVQDDHHRIEPAPKEKEFFPPPEEEKKTPTAEEEKKTPTAEEEKTPAQSQEKPLTPNQPPIQRNETFVAELQSFDKPPYVWNVELGAERDFTSTEDLRQLVNRMHDRQLLEAQELDIPRTVVALTTHPGQVQLFFRQLTQAPSYLLLIDQRTQNDHRARIFNLLYEYLKFNEVDVKRFYFSADPKLCFNDDFPYGIPLAQLYALNRSARLLILTYGYELFSPSSNAWSPWTRVFLQWQDRAILSPLPTQNWGAMEQKLAERFTLLPATPLGLAAAIEEFKAEEAKHWEDYLAQITDAVTEPIYYQGDLIETLHRYFPDPVVQRWIAACALYPTLHWELTLHLGALLQSKYGHSSLTSIENLLELARLPWFIEGRIPDVARDELIQWLEVLGEEASIRNLLLESLNRAPAPPPDSVAYADYRMQLVFNQWMLEQDAELKARLEEEFNQYLRAGKSADFVTFKRLERGAKRTELVVPESWRSSIVIEPPSVGESSKTNPAITPIQPRKINPPLAIYLSGDQDGVDLARQYAIEATGKTTLDWAPNLTIEWLRLVNDEHQADYVLHAEEGVWYTRLPFDKRPLLLPIKFREGNSIFAHRANNVFEGFKQMAKWHYFKNLDAFSTDSTPSPFDQDWPIEIRIFEELDKGSETRIYPVNGQFLLEFTKDKPTKDLRFELENRSPEWVYISLLYLDYCFGIATDPIWDKPRALEPGAIVSLNQKNAGNFFDFILDRYIKEYCWPGEQNYLKLIISKTPFDAQAFDMDSLPLPNEAHNSPRVFQDLTRQVSDWNSRTYGLFSNNPYFDAEQARALASGERTIQPFDADNDTDLTIPDHMVLVKGGTFEMGEENNTHSVTLSDFYIGKHQLTFAEYDAFCRATGRELTKDRGWGRGTRPVINVSWFDAIDYCNWRSQEEGLQQVYQVNKEQVTPNWSANGYRLPTEAEWEFAARGGSESQGFTYAGSNNVDEVAWFSENSGAKTQPVGQKKANELGIYDMSGNVWEWCWDWYSAYSSSATKDPKGPDTGSIRVLRCGSWFYDADGCRVAFRSDNDPNVANSNCGFRIARPALHLEKQKELELETWNKIPKNDPSSLERYIRDNPQSPFVEEAQRLIGAIQEVQDSMVLVKGGTFEMGDVMGDKEYENETVHTVTVSNFFLAKNELTFEEYDAFCTATGRELPDDSGWGRGKRPVINVDWYDAIEYCNWRSSQEGLQTVYSINKNTKDSNNSSPSDTKQWQVTTSRSANGYRLPTEAEWEYAARQGGQKVRFGNGKDIADPQEINFNALSGYKKRYSVVGEYRQKTLPVGSFSPNTLDLFDMSGNVWEWCGDWYGPYPSSASNDPQGATGGSDRVFRGGSWRSNPIFTRVALRYRISPGDRSGNKGFRLARAAVAPEKQRELELETWNKIPKNDSSSLERYIRDNPQSSFVEEAQRLIAIIQEVEDSMVLVKGGAHEMREGKNTHRVTLSDFYISSHQLTFEEYDAFCKLTGRELTKDAGWGRGTRPVINVNWFDAIDYCNWRSQQENLKPVYNGGKDGFTADWSANGYRLPTEAEWEYAAKGGLSSRGFKYAGSNNVDEVAWYGSNSGNKTQPVGQKKANELGLFDMSGNVQEWCWDWYEAYSNRAFNDPRGPDFGMYRVLRSGSWFNSSDYCRVAHRDRNVPRRAGDDYGFRLARSVISQENQKVLELEAWNIVPKNDPSSLERYIRDNPQSSFVEEAQRLIAIIQEKQDSMVLVKGGTFQMGEVKKNSHQVTLSDFLIAKRQLTFDEFDAFCKATSRELPSDRNWGRGDRPAINVNWFDAVDYCNWRSQEEGLQQVYHVNMEQVTPNWSANGYRLPTEAEWEYAARGGSESQGFTYAGSRKVLEVAWFSENSGGSTHLVGQKKTNELGLFDMSGNVWEWCWDWHAAYPNSFINDPRGPSAGSRRVLRGGSWLNEAELCHVATRLNYNPLYADNRFGFRLARSVVSPEKQEEPELET
ncbi:formylglycine-generating enzyme family protein [Haliscomenobacter hydrossis]|uniref:Sulphatase-modifying factor protein n=1 Tax=Haliscomenobacter hydrossis (strain ATCC 27775 / DSM 1100 / LMG 10767 / O) TaxID=760192 RepID=F4L7M4_HALH1|nr:SUMF1/EgtB/PvdO family nonheme iron enzyme [Haliscomenobacter hydrossis]AEE54382.1 Sulphatase-modifying factor protein [Haliscomenobacter hydrossis DSM 1100]